MELVLLALAVIYGPSPGAVVLAAPYYAAACVACLYALVSELGARRAAFPGEPEEAWRTGLAARVATLVGWALAAVAVLKIWVAGAGRPPALLPLSFLLIAVGAWVADQTVAISDRPDQGGGAMPLRSGGRPRSRRLFFWLCVAYPLGLLPAASAVLFARGGRYPAALYPPRVALLVIALLFLAAMALVLQRYRGSLAKPRAPAIYPAAAALLAVSGAVAFSSSASLYVYSISAGCVAFGAVAARTLLTASAPGQ